MSHVLRQARIPRLVNNLWAYQPHTHPSPRTVNPAIVALQSRLLSTSNRRMRDEYEERAKRLNQKAVDDAADEVRQRQVRRPWLRQDADKPPVTEDGELSKTEPLSKGKLLTTPTRLLKLILPLPISVEKGTNSKQYSSGRAISANDDIQPLALLIHPQQPLSYVERLIQAEIPPIRVDDRDQIPNVYFRAEDTNSEEAQRMKQKNKHMEKDDGSKSPHVASYSGLGHEAQSKEDAEKNWVRWSGSTEVGDFIRDAARGREFAIDIDGYNIEMRVGVPSFRDRTYYMRQQLRKMSRQIEGLAKIKQECDLLAHRGAHRIAKGGFALLAGWWGVVYYITFQTEYGWDLVEPITYLAGLSTIMGGYLWFLYISRDLSYKAAMNVTVSRRQNALYEAKGFDVQKWEQVVREANALRSEIKTVAVEYDVDWDEAKDLGGEERGEEVKKVLDKARRDQKRSRDDDDDEDEGDDDSEEVKAEKQEAEKKDMEKNESK